jgi:hypothetical protein
VAVSQSIRDSQREKVYRSERTVFFGSPERPYRKDVTPEFKSVAECQEFVDHVTASDTWLKVLGVCTRKPVEVLPGKGRRRAGASYENVAIKHPRWTRDRWQILHELSHIATHCIYNNLEYDDTGGYWVLYETVAAHGPEYAGIYLYLVRQFLSVADHDRLEAAFREGRVKVAPIAVPSLEPAPIVVTDIDSEDGRCLQCSRELSNVGRRSKFCSDICSWTYHNHLRHLRGVGDRQKLCEACGVEFAAKRKDAKTCSARCRQRLRRA